MPKINEYPSLTPIEKLCKENNKLRAKNKALREALVMMFNGAWDEEHQADIDAYVKGLIDEEEK